MTAAHRILIVDDDIELGAMLGEYLSADGFEIDTATTGPAGLARAGESSYDLLILDIMLPEMSGLELLKQLRQSGAGTPVIMLTARGEDVDRILGLELGADDYLAKPFNPRELVARINAVLRRGVAGKESAEPVELRIGRWTLNRNTRRLATSDATIELTDAELRLLWTLAKQPGEVTSRATLNEIALGRPLQPFDRALDTHISNLRGKIKPLLGAQEQSILSVRGRGYRLALDGDSD